MKTNYPLIFLISFFSLSAFSQDSISSNQVNHSTLKFIENKGQITNHQFEARPDVLFHVQGKDIFLRNSGITYMKINRTEMEHEAHEKVEEIEDSEEGLGLNSEPQLLFGFLQEEEMKIHQIDMDFVGINVTTKVQKINEDKDLLNYYLPQCPNGVNNVKLFEQIIYEDLYNGIDASFYGGIAGRFKYDFIVAPNANPDQIKMRWSGADSLTLSSDGDLVIHNKIEAFHEQTPFVYQIINKDTTFVSVNYKLVKNKVDYFVSFELGDYNANFELIIDPWITHYGGTGSEYITSNCLDPSGDIILAGYTTSVDVVGVGGYLDELNGVSDCLISKFSADGNRIWGTYYGGSISELLWDLDVDIFGNVYFAGTSQSDDVIASVDAFQPIKGLYGDAFLVKLDGDGDRVWGTYYGGENFDYGKGIKVHEDHVYLVGQTFSETGITEDGYIDDYIGEDGASNAFMVKLTLDGDRVWGTYYGGPEYDAGSDLTLDDDGNLYLVGVTSSDVGIVEDGFDETIDGVWADLFLVKFNPAMEREWGTYYGGTDIEGVHDLITDADGNIYLTGYANSEDGIASPGAFQTEKTGLTLTRDGFLIKFDSGGDRLWATYVGGGESDYLNSIDWDPETNNVIVSGDTYSADYPVTECAVQAELIGEENGVITQFNPDGTLYCSSFFGQDHMEDLNAFFSGCYIYASGGTLSEIATPGAYQDYHGGGISDAFVAQMFKVNCGMELPELIITSEEVLPSSCDPCDGVATVNVEFDCPSINSFVDYKWSTGFEVLNTLETTSSIEGICAGEYWCEITTNCDVIDTVFFDFGDEIALVEALFTVEGNCVNDAWVFTNNSESDAGIITSYNWNFGDGGSSADENPSHIFDAPGTYEITLSVENEFGCTDELAISITVYSNFTGFEEIVVCKDSIYTFPDGFDEVISGDMTYTSTLTTPFGCDSVIISNVSVTDHYYRIDTIYVNPGQEVTYPDNTSEIIEENAQHLSDLPSTVYCDSIIQTLVFVNTTFYVPNSFTPDGDNHNNTFQPVFTAGFDIYDYHLTIYNRWGELLFESYNAAYGWDGTYGAELVQDGVYIWQIVFGDLNTDQKYTHNGHVTLLR